MIYLKIPKIIKTIFKSREGNSSQLVSEQPANDHNTEIRTLDFTQSANLGNRAAVFTYRRGPDGRLYPQYYSNGKERK